MVFKTWILKAIVQKVISVLPFSFRINYFFQRFVTRRVRITDAFLETMMGHHRESVEYWQKHGGKIEGAKILELGTGWHPVIPVLHFLSGADQVVTVDLRSLLLKNNLVHLLTCLMRMAKNGRLKELMVNYDPARIKVVSDLLAESHLHDLNTILSRLNIHQEIADATALDYPDDYFDFCTSVNVLEHVDTPAIPGIIREMKRLTKTGGLHYHAIGTYDHFVHVDQAISKFNYLKYSSKQWKRIDNSIQPQNRLRLSWFRDLFIDLGLDICDEILWEAEPLEVEKIEVHEDFNDADLLDVPYGTYILKISE